LSTLAVVKVGRSDSAGTEFLSPKNWHLAFLGPILLQY